jgi:hypothetical protein
MKVPVVEGMVGLDEEGGELRHISFNSMAVTEATTTSMLLCLQSSAHWALASTMMMPAGPSILSSS